MYWIHFILNNNFWNKTIFFKYLCYTPTSMSQGERQPIPSQKISGNEQAEKPSRIPDRTIAFVQKAFAAGADGKLTEPQKIFIAHVVAKPDLTLQEQAPYAGVATAVEANNVLKRVYKILWQASPPELKQQTTIIDLARRNRRIPHNAKRIPFTAEHRAKLSEAKKNRDLSPAELEHVNKLHELRKGSQHSPETRARMSEALKGKKHSPETRAKMSEAKKGKKRKPFTAKHRARISEAKKGRSRKPFTTEHRTRLSESHKNREERKKQKEAELAYSQQIQPEFTQVIPPQSHA
jgi:NUMOD3 motif